MDVMEIRRRLMMGMTNGGTPLSDFFEILERFTPSEDLVTYTFRHTGEGRYIFCEDPPLTIEKATADSYPANSLFSGSGCIHRSNSGELVGRSELSITTRSNGHTDYWGSRFILDGNYVTIGISSSNSNIVSFRQGKTYVILKMKI